MQQNPMILYRKQIKSEIVVQSYNMQMKDNCTVTDVDGMRNPM
jgi:hypothetical protein